MSIKALFCMKEIRLNDERKSEVKVKREMSELFNEQKVSSFKFYESNYLRSMKGLNVSEKTKWDIV